MARRASFLAGAPGLSFFHGLALRRGGMTAWGAAVCDGVVAAACVVGAVPGDGAGRLALGDLVEQVRQHVRAALGPMALALTIADMAAVHRLFRTGGNRR